MTIKELKERWYTPQGQQHHTDAITWLHGHGPRPTHLGEHNGRLDLRGLPTPP